MRWWNRRAPLSFSGVALRSVLLPLLFFLLTACDPHPGPFSDLSSSPLQASTGGVYGSDQDPGLLVGVFDVEVSPDGSVYVCQPQVAEIAVFREDGSYSRTIGGRGSGPGEFQNPGAIRFLADTLTVLEFGRGITLLSPEGEYYARVSFLLDPPTGHSFPMAPITLLADGNVGCFSPLSASTVLRGNEVHVQFWLKATRQGDVLDTLVIQPVDGEYSLVEVPGEQDLTLTHPLAWNDLVTLPPDGSQLVAVDRSSGFQSSEPAFRLFRINLAGDTTHGRELGYDPAPLTSEEKARISENLAQRLTRRLNTSVGRLAEIIQEQIHWPPHFPPVSKVVAGSDGTIWLQREELPGDSIRWDILGPDSEPRAHVYLSTSLDVKRVSRESVWGVQAGEMDVPVVVRVDLNGYDDH